MLGVAPFWYDYFPLGQTATGLVGCKLGGRNLQVGLVNKC